MTIYTNLVSVLWLLLVLFWLVSALFAKKSAVQRINWQRTIWFRVLLIIAVVLVVRTQSAQHTAVTVLTFSFTNPIINLLGVILCAAGIGLAVWARVYLGRNWGMPMSLRQGHELVTTGPYRFIRHPIYSGILLAALGSVLASTAWWLFLFLAYGGYFFYSVGVEEKMMMEQFPDQYPAYKTKTKRLIPFIY